jgi:branched-chain amino acid transport system permease protein
VNLSLLLQVLLSGLAAGALYGIVGLGYGLIFRMSGVLNFAHGDLVTLGIFAFLLAVGGGGAVGVATVAPAVLVPAAIMAVAAVLLAAVLVHRYGVAPMLARNSVVGWVAATAAAGLLLRSIVGARFQADSYSIPDLLPTRQLGRGGVLDLPGGGIVEARTLVVIGVAALLAVGFDTWLRRSRTGLAMRVAADDPSTAELVGVSTRRLRLLAWLIAGLLAAIAGLLLAPSRPVTLELGVVLGLKGTAAAVLGGLGSGRGALVAGLCLGVFESVVTTAAIPAIQLGPVSLPPLGPSPGLQDVVALALLVLVLAILPGRAGAVDEATD